MRPLRHAALLLTLLLSAEWCGQGELQAQTDRNSEEVTRLLFVFDASNSMNAYWGRRRKWDVARDHQVTLTCSPLDFLVCLIKAAWDLIQPHMR